MPSLPTWRSLLFVPVTAERFVAKAHTRGADVIILDLEDSIPPAENCSTTTCAYFAHGYSTPNRWLKNVIMSRVRRKVRSMSPRRPAGT